MTTLLKLITMNKCIFDDFRDEEFEDIIEKNKKDFEEIQNSFSSENLEKVQTLLLHQKDYMHTLGLKEKDNCVILALKIGIELGKYFQLLEDF